MRYMNEFQKNHGQGTPIPVYENVIMKPLFLHTHIKFLKSTEQIKQVPRSYIANAK